MNVSVRAMRLPFLTGSLIPVLLAAGLAFHHGFFLWVELLLVLVGVGSLHLAANLINDFFDAKGSDLLNLHPTPFSGGSRVIPEALLSSRKVLSMALFFFGLGSLSGLVLLGFGHYYVALIGLLGLLAGLLYSVEPFKFMSRGFGELSIFLAFGPLITWGTYYVMSGQLTWQAFFLGFPLGFLITAVIWINQFPDYKADQAAGKNNLVVRMGLEHSRYVYPVLMLLPFPFLFLLWGTQDISFLIMVAWLALPLAWKGIRIFRIRYATYDQIIPAQALTIQSHLFLGTLMLAGILIGHFFG
ncbi:MAG: 1,4-dihydroxy-2-naphthoate octaprenyltransferase [Thermodesulfobacteriota bacterium]